MLFQDRDFERACNRPRSQMHDMLQESNKLILLGFSSKCAERLPISKSTFL